MELPILCTLTEAELGERRRTILSALQRMQPAVTPLPEGYRYAFKPTSQVLTELSHLVDIERQCCQFLTFKIIVEPGGLAVQLEVTGPPGAQAVIADLFGGAI